MRAQKEVIMWTAQGAPDKGLEETRNYVISLLETGEVIGTGGTYRRECELGWPAIGYAFRKEAWGKGYATEFLSAFMQNWWKLLRVESLIQVDRATLGEEEIAASPNRIVAEQCTAEKIEDNLGSNRVLEKAAFR
ncbi:GNAT domain-containing protein [Fusarium oxysporum]|nr:GNAT domain-containing protein [Fusarium oxysporum]